MENQNYTSNTDNTLIAIENAIDFITTMFEVKCNCDLNEYDYKELREVLTIIAKAKKVDVINQINHLR